MITDVHGLYKKQETNMRNRHLKSVSILFNPCTQMPGLSSYYFTSLLIEDTDMLMKIELIYCAV